MVERQAGGEPVGSVGGTQNRGQVESEATINDRSRGRHARSRGSSYAHDGVATNTISNALREQHGKYYGRMHEEIESESKTK